MNTDDASTLPEGGMKIEIISGRVSQKWANTLTVGFGPIENLEVSAAFARATDNSNTPSTQMDGTMIGIKWVPIQHDNGWSFGASIAHGGTTVDERSTPVNYTEKEESFAALATLRMESGQVLHLNLGITIVEVQETDDSVRHWSLGYEFPLTSDLQLTAEIFGEEKSSPDKAIGLRYRIAEGLKAYGGAGKGNGRSFMNLGVAWEF